MAFVSTSAALAIFTAVTLNSLLSRCSFTHAAAINKYQQVPGRSVELLLTLPRLPGRTLGQRITRFRRERGLQQKQLAQLAGVDEMTIVRWEKDRSAPKGPRLTRLLRALDVQTDELQSDRGQDQDDSQRPPLVRSANVRVLPPPG